MHMKIKINISLLADMIVRELAVIYAVSSLCCLNSSVCDR